MQIQTISTDVVTESLIRNFESDSVAITGLGIISPLGESLADIQKNLKLGFVSESAIETISYKEMTGLKIKEFDYKKYLGDKGLRFWDRSALLMGCAVKQVLDQSKLLERYSSAEIGLVVASDAATKFQIQFSKDTFADPVFNPNPQMFPNVLTNPIAGQIAMKFNLGGENVTISNGHRSFLDAWTYAHRKVARGIEKVFIVAGGEAVSEELLHRYQGLFLPHQIDRVSEIGCAFVLEKNTSNMTDAEGILNTLRGIFKSSGYVYGFKGI